MDEEQPVRIVFSFDFSEARGAPYYPQSLHHLNTVLTKRSIRLTAEAQI